LKKTNFFLQFVDGLQILCYFAGFSAVASIARDGFALDELGCNTSEIVVVRDGLIDGLF